MCHPFSNLFCIISSVVLQCALSRLIANIQFTTGCEFSIKHDRICRFLRKQFESDAIAKNVRAITFANEKIVSATNPIPSSVHIIYI